MVSKQDILTHVDASGQAKMVDVGEKAVTRRRAVAGGFIAMKPATLSLIKQNKLKKGDALQVARLAGIMAAKRTHELIPLCHPLLLSHIDVQIRLRDDGAEIESTVVCEGKTGVEMEALTACSVAALTIYDMCKSVDKSMAIGDIRLLEKEGGRSGRWVSG
ncbi:MAG: cyclic pyranopterin monophosphate synthase MoaC [bacterium]